MFKFAAALLVLIVGIISWQQYRYHQIRRMAAEDQQTILHSRKVFHVMYFFTVHDGEKVIESAKRFWENIASKTEAQLIYAGQAAWTAQSKQINDVQWDGVLLVEYGSREQFDAHWQTADAKEASSAFSHWYAHGMERHPIANFTLPIVLLKTRLTDLLQGKLQLPPLVQPPAYDTAPEYDFLRSRVARLRAVNMINPNGLVVFNLLKHGSAEERAANNEYTSTMLSRMAASAHGPLHIGRAASIDSGSDDSGVQFDQVAIVFYPSATYFSQLISSEFFINIFASKQLADSTSVPTIPITQQVQ